MAGSGDGRRWSPEEADAAEEGDGGDARRAEWWKWNPKYGGTLIRYGGRELACFLRVPGDIAAGGALGYAFGYGSALLGKKGFRGSLVDARSSAKLLAIISGVHSVVTGIFKTFFGKEDAISASVAGCCIGLALSYPGTPFDLLGGCITFGALSGVLEGVNQWQSCAALAATAAPAGGFVAPAAAVGYTEGVAKGKDTVLPPFTLHLSPDIVKGCLAFREKLLRTEA